MTSKNEINSLIQLLIDRVTSDVAEKLISTVEKYIDIKVTNALKGQKLLVDSDELAKQLMVSKSTVVKLRKQGLPTLRIGDSVRFDPNAVISFLKNNTKN